MCLPRVNVSADRITRSVCGLRPYRRSGFVVRSEKIGEALVIHNYGHGGAGITLSWGTARLAVDLGAPGHSGPVAVLGSGGVGLSTARLLQDSGFQVTIYAKDLPPNTTSDVAGGFWYPVTLFQEQFRTPAFNDQFPKACKFAFTRYQTMVGSRYGVRWTRNFQLAHSAFRDTGDFSRQGVVGSLTPVKGQLTFLLPQPEIEYSVVPGNLYMFSRRDGIALGGTHDEGSWSLDVDNQVRDQIIAKHKDFFDSMRAC